MNTSHVVPVPADRLSVDSRVQRSLDPRRVKLVATAWDDLMVGVLTVSQRIDPEWAQNKDAALGLPSKEAQLVVLDGQTRLAAFRAVNGENTKGTLRCEVHTGLTLAEEASIFLQHNNRKAVAPVDRFRIALVAEEKWAINIQGITARHGWYAQGTEIPGVSVGKARRFSAVSAAEKIYRTDDGLSLTRTFETISDAWPHAAGTVCTETLNGLGLMYSRHPELDAHGMTVKLAKIGYGKYISSVSDYRRANTGMSIAQAAYRFTLDLYNRGRRTHRIDA